MFYARAALAAITAKRIIRHDDAAVWPEGAPTHIRQEHEGLRVARSRSLYDLAHGTVDQTPDTLRFQDIDL